MTQSASRRVATIRHKDRCLDRTHAHERATMYCYSEERAEKERGIVERFATRFETAR